MTAALAAVVLLAAYAAWLVTRLADVRGSRDAWRQAATRRSRELADARHELDWCRVAADHADRIIADLQQENTYLRECPDIADALLLAENDMHGHWETDG